MIAEKHAGLSALLQPGRIGTLTLKNRVVMAAIATKLTTNAGGVSHEYIEFLAARAEGGVGLIVAENGCVDWPRGKGGSTLLRFDQEEAIPGLNQLVDRVHESDTRLFAQLQHVGRQTSSRFTQGISPVSSVVRRGVGSDIDPHALTVAEIEEICALFGAAARRAQQAGFDGVEIHGGHGYLITQFLSPALNSREDEYGGSFDHRAQFVRDLMRSVRSSVGSDYPIIFRYSADEHVPGGLSADEAIALGSILEDEGADALHISAGIYEAKEWVFPPMAIDAGYNLELSERIRSAVGIPIIVVGKLGDPTLAASALHEGKADFIALGRPLIADPNWVRRVASAESERIRPCIYCNECIRRVAAQHPIRCAVNPDVGREATQTTAIADSNERHKVVVVGAGPAGLEAARSLAVAGYHVLIVEKENSTGGHLKEAAIPPGKAVLRHLIDFYDNEIDRLGIGVLFSTEATAETIAALRPDFVVLSHGGTPFDGNIAVTGSQTARAEAVLLGQKQVWGPVVIVGGGRVGCELAHFLMAQGIEGSSIEIVEMQSELAIDMEPIARTLLIRELLNAGVKTQLAARVTRIDGGRVLLEVPQPGESVAGKAEIDAEWVLMASGFVPNTSLSNELQRQGVAVHVVGDAREIGGIFEAVHAGARAAHELTGHRGR